VVINKVYRYFCGYIHFNAINGFTERLINLCASNNISLTDLVKTPEGFEAITLACDYKKIVEFSKKVNVETNIIKKVGVPFRAGTYKKRYGLMIGAVIFIAFILISQNYIWQIEVKGNKKVSTQVILSELNDLGVRKWGYIPDIDFREKKQQALLKLPELSWLSINQRGCKIDVLVSERYAPPTIRENTPCDIVANKTGQIKYMEVYNGQTVKGINYTVSEGDIIVSGTFVNKQGVTSYVHSEAKIIAEVQFEKTLQIDIEQLSKEYTGKTKKRYYIDILSAKIPLFLATKIKNNYDVEEVKKPLVLFSKELPLGIYTKEYRFYNKKSDSLTQEQAKKILEDSFKEYEQIELENCSITDRKISTTINNGILKMQISYTTEQDIAKKVNIAQ